MSAANRPENRPRRADVATEYTQNESKHIIAEPLAVASGCYGQPGTVFIDSSSSIRQFNRQRKLFVVMLSLASTGYRERFCKLSRSCNQVKL